MERATASMPFSRRLFVHPQYQNEFISAQSKSIFVLSNILLQYTGGFCQQPVSLRMPICVIDDFQAIDIHHADRNDFAGFLRLAQQPGKSLLAARRLSRSVSSS